MLPKIYSYIIVGSGAGGSAAGYRLARAGYSVLLLERGKELPDDGSTLEVEQVIRRAAFTCPEAWLDRHGPARLQEYFNLGGKTKWYGAALMRMDAREFEADPAHLFRGWPFTLEDLEPFYAEAERLLEVRVFNVEPDLRRIVDGIRRRDPLWQENLQPLGLAAGILADRRAAQRFDGFALPSGDKSDAESKLLDKIRQLPGVCIRTGCDVTDLLPAEGDPTTIAGVVCSDGRRFRGKQVLLAAGALHSPRILQTYIRQHRLQRIVPGADLVGRYYKCHIGSLILCVSRSRLTDLLHKTVWLSHPAFPHTMVQTIGCQDGEIIAARLPRCVPESLSGLVGARAYSFLVMTEDGSHPDNRVIGATDVGSPPRLDYDFTRLPTVILEHRRMRRMLRGCLLRQGLLPLTKRIALYSSSHACGTMIAGNDPATSVVDAGGAVRGLRNLYVVDGSALPRPGRVNPALTIYAWALRVAWLLQCSAVSMPSSQSLIGI